MKYFLVGTRSYQNLTIAAQHRLFGAYWYQSKILESTVSLEVQDNKYQNSVSVIVEWKRITYFHWQTFDSIFPQ